MKGQIKHIAFQGRQLFIYTPPSYGEQDKHFPVLYSHDGQEVNKLSEGILSKIEKQFEADYLQEFIWVGIYPEKRQHEYTPWPAPALDSRFEDFKGQGKAYIDFIVNQVKVYIDQHYDTKADVESTWMMGYSLGGLISIYSAYETPLFGKIGSICGSFWYEHIVEWIREHQVLNNQVELFMYYGKKEGKGKKTIQQYAVERTEQVIDYLKDDTSGVKKLQIGFDEGGHHQYVSDRYEKMITYIASKEK